MDYSAEESFKIKCSSSCNWSWQKCTIVLVVHSRDNDTDGTWFDIKDIHMIQLLIGIKQNFFGIKQSLSRYKQTSTAHQFIFVMCIQHQRWLIGTINNVVVLYLYYIFLVADKYCVDNFPTIFIDVIAMKATNGMCKWDLETTSIIERNKCKKRVNGKDQKNNDMFFFRFLSRDLSKLIWSQDSWPQVE